MRVTFVPMSPLSVLYLINVSELEMAGPSENDICNVTQIHFSLSLLVPLAQPPTRASWYNFSPLRANLMDWLGTIWEESKSIPVAGGGNYWGNYLPPQGEWSEILSIKTSTPLPFPALYPVPPFALLGVGWQNSTRHSNIIFIYRRELCYPPLSFFFLANEAVNVDFYVCCSYLTIKRVTMLGLLLSLYSCSTIGLTTVGGRIISIIIIISDHSGGGLRGPPWEAEWDQGSRPCCSVWSLPGWRGPQARSLAGARPDVGALSSQREREYPLQSAATLALVESVPPRLEICLCHPFATLSCSWWRYEAAASSRLTNTSELTG